MSEKAPERIWYARTKWGMVPLTNGPSAEHDNVEYVRADLLATARREEREAAFKEAIDAVRAKAKYLGQSDRQVAAQQVNGCLRAIDAIESAAKAGSEGNEQER